MMEQRIENEEAFKLRRSQKNPEETHQHFHKTGEFSFCSQVKLVIFKLHNNHWTKYEFPSTQAIVRVGSNSFDSDIFVNDNAMAEVQLVVRLLGDKWYVFERGSEDLTKFNGIKKRQAILLPGTASVVKIKDHTFIFKTIRLTPEKIEQASQKKFEIKTFKGDYSFAINRPALIGANEACDIQIPGEEFAAIINSYGNNFYLYPVLSSEGAPETYPLSTNSEIQVNNEPVTFHLPKSCEDPYGFKMVRDCSKAHLAFLETDGADRQVYNKLLLPGKGESISIGRDKGNYFPIESMKLSRKHCQIMIYRNSVLLVDFKSTNGTYINSERINKKVAHPGDTIRFGNKKYVLGYSE